MIAVPLWRMPVQAAKDRSKRIEAETEKKRTSLEEQKERMRVATERAQASAVILVMRSEDLAESVARQKTE